MAPAQLAKTSQTARGGRRASGDGASAGVKPLKRAPGPGKKKKSFAEDNVDDLMNLVATIASESESKATRKIRDERQRAETHEAAKNIKQAEREKRRARGSSAVEPRAQQSDLNIIKKKLAREARDKKLRKKRTNLEKSRKGAGGKDGRKVAFVA